MSVADIRPTRAGARPTPRKILGARPRDDDAALVLRVQAGDEEAFAAIFKRHHASLLSYCRHMLGNRDEGEDALQQAFIKAHQALLRGTAPRELRPWLYAIARNCCLSAIAARRPTAQLQDHAPALAGLSEEVHQREDLRELLAGIGRLPEDQRSALLLAELDDLSHQAIATVVGCQVSKVKALIYQARTALIADRDARNTPCQEIREELAVARGGELRRGPLRRHLKLCAGCRDFQLVVGAQRESLACVLPVAPSAGLVAAVLGHAGAHAAGVAGIGGTGAGAGAVPAGGAAGTSVGASTAGATTLASGVASKLAVGGAIAALAAAGTVVAHRRLPGANSPRVSHARLASFAGSGREVAGSAGENGDSVTAPGSIANNAAPATPGETPLSALAGAAGPPESPVLSPFLAATSGGGVQSLSTLTGTSTPDPSVASVPAHAATRTGQGKVGTSALVRARKARVKLRREALRRRALRLREARRRERLSKARQRALRRAHRLVASKSVKPVKSPIAPVAPAPARPHRRKADALATEPSTTVGTSSSESNTTTKGKAGRGHPTVAGTGSTGAKTTGVDPETGASGSEKAGSSTGKSKVVSSGGDGDKSASGAGGKETSGAKAGKTGSETGSGAVDTNAPGDTGKASGTSSRPSETAGPNGAGTDGTATSGTAPSGTGASGASTNSDKTGSVHSKKHLLEAEQLPNL